MTQRKTSRDPKALARPVPAPVRKTPEQLAAEQGVEPVTDPARLRGDFWPDTETADDFIAAVRRWRREGAPEGDR